MITIEKTQVVGWEPAIRGMRNPLNSWDKSDSYFDCDNCPGYAVEGHEMCDKCNAEAGYIGENDHALMMKLAASGSDHAKFRRMIVVYADITAPLYWWKQFDTYKVGTVTNSCSTMHKIHEKEFTLDDFSHDNLEPPSIRCLESTIETLNIWRELYLGLISDENGNKDEEMSKLWEGKKESWWQMIQLLPTSYNQRRTIMLNYEVLANIYHSRRNHKLAEWHELCSWIESLPYSEIITGNEVEK